MTHHSSFYSLEDYKFIKKNRLYGNAKNNDDGSSPFFAVTKVM